MAQNKRIVSSAPGKVILFGEHAVVLGKTAIATSLGLRTYAYFNEFDYKEDTDIALKLNFPDLQVQRSWTHSELQPYYSQASVPINSALFPSGFSLHSASNGLGFEDFVESLNKLTGETSSTTTTARGLIAFLYLYFTLNKLRQTTTDKNKGLSVCIRSYLPVGMGLGSSAAFSVSIVSGLVNLFQLTADDQSKFINEWSFQAERIMHGTPSGIDNTVSTYGGTLTMTRGSTVTINHLENTPSIPFLLVNTKVPRNTGALVKKVGLFQQQQPDVANPMLDEIHNISLSCIHLFEVYNTIPKSEFFGKLEKLIDRNQELLNGIGVGHEVLDKVCKITSNHGLHTKLTGAGGGGCALTLLPDNTDNSVIEQAKSSLESEGFQCFRAEVGGNGYAINSPEELPFFNELFNSK